MDNYQIKKRITKTLYGDVLLCVPTASKAQVAIKRINLKHASAMLSVENDIPILEDAFVEREVNILMKNKSENVLNMLSEFEENGVMHFVYEYCPGDLYNRLTTKLTIQDIQKYFSQIVAGVHCLHENGYAHRDLSLENVLIGSNDVCKICDFGLASKVTKKTTEPVGKSFYMAPEVYESRLYTPRGADMWSLGIILFILLTGVPLTTEPSCRDSRFQYMKNRGIRALLSSWEDVIPSAAIELLEGLLEITPEKRMSMNQLRQSEWVLACPNENLTI